VNVRKIGDTGALSNVTVSDPLEDDLQAGQETVTLNRAKQSI
jgi:hypothetical protein